MKHYLIAIVLVLLAAVASAQTVVSNPVTFTWDNNPEPDVRGYKIAIDRVVRDVGQVTSFVDTLLAGSHLVSLAAYNDIVTGPSTDEIKFEVKAVVTGCEYAPNIAVQSWDHTVVVGEQGLVLFKLANPFPIVQVQAKLGGSQVVGQMDGTDLRASPGIYFSMPRALGTYNLTVFVKDAPGCSGETTLVRPITVVVQ